MKQNITVQRARRVINNLGLLDRINYLKEYRSVERKERYTENEIRKYIYNLAKDDNERTYLFVEKILKQINLMVL